MSRSYARSPWRIRGRGGVLVSRRDAPRARSREPTDTASIDGAHTYRYGAHEVVTGITFWIIRARGGAPGALGSVASTVNVSPPSFDVGSTLTRMRSPGPLSEVDLPATAAAPPPQPGHA